MSNTNPLDEIPEEDKIAALRLLSLYKEKATYRQLEVINKITARIKNGLVISDDEAELITGCSLQEAAAEAALRGCPMDLLLEYLEENFDDVVNKGK